MATDDRPDHTLDAVPYLFDGIEITTSDQLPPGTIFMSPTDDEWRDFIGFGIPDKPIEAPRLPYVWDVGTHGDLGRSRCQSCNKQFCEPSDCRVHAVVARLANRTIRLPQPEFRDGEPIIFDQPRRLGRIVSY